MIKKRKNGKPDRRSTKKPTIRAMKALKARASGATYKEAGIAAGYSPKNAAQSSYQAINQLRGRIPDLLEKKGLGEEVAIEKYLKPLLEAEETKFFNEGRKRINVAALAIRLAAVRELFLLHGSYAPRDPKEAAQFGVKVVVMDLPRPPRLPAPGNGKPPADSNGHD